MSRIDVSRIVNQKLFANFEIDELFLWVQEWLEKNKSDISVVGVTVFPDELEGYIAKIFFDDFSENRLD